MKRILFLFLLISSVAFVSAQIGINTETPLGIFHVDAFGNNSATPTAAQIVDDVVITSAGNIGLGTLTPTVKVEIGNVSTLSSPLRIEDNSTFAAKVLESVTADGTAMWTEQPASYAKTYRACTFGQIFPFDGLTVLALNENMVIPQNGKYLVTLRWWGYNRVDAIGDNILSGYIYVRKKGTTAYLDQIEYYLVGTKGDVLTFTTSLYLGDRVAGEIMEVLVRPVIGAGGAATPIQWQLMSTTSNVHLMPQVILYSI